MSSLNEKPIFKKFISIIFIKDIPMLLCFLLYFIIIKLISNYLITIYDFLNIFLFFFSKFKIF